MTSTPENTTNYNNRTLPLFSKKATCVMNDLSSRIDRRMVVLLAMHFVSHKVWLVSLATLMMEFVSLPSVGLVDYYWLNWLMHVGKIFTTNLLYLLTYILTNIKSSCSC